MKTRLLLLPSFVSLALNAAHAAPAMTSALMVPPTVAVGGGDLNITNTDVSRLVSQEMNEYFSRQREDKEFFIHTINEIEQAANKINSDVVMGQLTAASQKSQLMSYVNAGENGRPAETGAIGVENFFKMMNLYNTAKQVLQNKIKGISAMSKGALPSAALPATDKKAELPAHLNIDFANISAYYENRIKEMDAAIDALTFKVKDKAGLVYDVSGFHLDASKMTVLTNDERVVRQAQIDKLRSNMRSLESKQDQYTVMVRELVETHLTNFGTSERMRSQSTQDLEARKRDYQRLVEVFWARSYLRQKYGIPLGAVGTIYKKRFFRIEELLASPASFVEFEKVPYRSKKDLLRAEESFRQSATAIDNKSASIFDGNFSLVSRAGALASQWGGWSALTDSAGMVLKLLAADVAEELMLLESGGQLKVRDFFKKRYMSDSDSKLSTQKLLCAYDSAAQPAGKCQDTSHATAIDQERMTGGDPVTLFRQILRQSDLQLGSYQQAHQLQEQLDAMTNLKNNPLNETVRRGNETLWD